MKSVQRVPVIEEITLSDSDEEIHVLDDEDPERDKNVCKTITGGIRDITNKFPRKNFKFAIEQVYLEGDFEIFDVPDSSDDETIKKPNVNSPIKANNKINDAIVEHEDYDEDTETDDDQFYIDEEAKDSNTACNEPIDLSLVREDERLSSIFSSITSLSSKSDDDKFSSVSSNLECSKDLNIQTDEEKLNDVFKEDMEIVNATSDDESAEGEMKVISMPQRRHKQFRIRGKTYIETICVSCQIERRISGKLWQHKTCPSCKNTLQFQCANCKRQFSSYTSTMCHLKKECLSKKFWSCPQCAYSVLDEKKLEIHIKKRHLNAKQQSRKKSTDKEEIYHCQMCNYSNKIKNIVTRHYNSYHLKDARPICVPDITSRSNINSVAKRKTEEEIKAEQKRLNKSIALNCPKCTRNLNYTGTHIKKCEICEGPLAWQCIPCKELSKSYIGIYEHLQNSCMSMFKACANCSKKFSADDLEKHQHICGQDLYLQCELCNYKTRSKVIFLKHVKYKHNLRGDEICKWL